MGVPTPFEGKAGIQVGGVATVVVSPALRGARRSAVEKQSRDRVDGSCNLQVKVKEPMRYAIVIEQAEGNFSAYVPDLPGCVATGATLEEVESEIRSAIEFHLEGLREDGEPIPPPSSRVEYVEVAA
jgi:predicted RNase H-like HicB family nuclease